MKNEIELTPSYWASVSGGKDSLLMLQIILKNLDKYPLNAVVHFELEIDYPFIKDVVNEMENMCKPFGIPFYRVTPRKNWSTLYDKYGFPSSRRRWCNFEYKLDCKKQVEEMAKEHNNVIKWYIGICADETKRIKDEDKNTIYPLVDLGVEEPRVLEWAKNQPIFKNYYRVCKRCGCMLCPMLSYIELAYMLKYYPTFYDLWINLVKSEETKVSEKLGSKWVLRGSDTKYDADYIDNIVRTKWLTKLEEKERETL